MLPTQSRVNVVRIASCVPGERAIQIVAERSPRVGMADESFVARPSDERVATHAIVRLALERGATRSFTTLGEVDVQTRLNSHGHLSQPPGPTAHRAESSASRSRLRASPRADDRA